MRVWMVPKKALSQQAIANCLDSGSSCNAAEPVVSNLLKSVWMDPKAPDIVNCGPFASTLTASGTVIWARSTSWRRRALLNFCFGFPPKALVILCIYEVLPLCPPSKIRPLMAILTIMTRQQRPSHLAKNQHFSWFPWSCKCRARRLCVWRRALHAAVPSTFDEGNLSKSISEGRHGELRLDGRLGQESWQAPCIPFIRVPFFEADLPGGWHREGQDRACGQDKHGRFSDGHMELSLQARLPRRIQGTQSTSGRQARNPLCEPPILPYFVGASNSISVFIWQHGIVLFIFFFKDVMGTCVVMTFLSASLSGLHAELFFGGCHQRAGSAGRLWVRSWPSLSNVFAWCVFFCTLYRQLLNGWACVSGAWPPVSNSSTNTLASMLPLN